jgi:NhaP-type Na+/H+ or K+/H+ antiporter
MPACGGVGFAAIRPAMPARIRKLIGGVGIVAFLIAYAVAVATIAGHLPDNALVKLAFFALAGLCWGVPLIPFISWMNRGR